MQDAIGMGDCVNNLSQPRNAGVRRRVMRVAATMMLLHTALLLTMHHRPERGALAVVLSIVAGSAMVGLLASIVPLALGMRDDEFQRALLLRSMAWGIGVTLAVTTVWGYVHLFGGGPAFESLYTFLLFGYSTGLINVYLRRRHRSAAQEL